jgi:hypothetical protein
MMVIGLVLALGLLLQGGAPARQAVRPGVVTGHINAKEGTPAAAVRVSAIPAPPPGIRGSDGSQYYDNPQPVSTALTDEQGRYRLERIPPGRYYILAGFLGQATFYPQTTDAEKATVVVIAANTTSENVDIKMLLPLGGRVSGRVSTPNTAVEERAVLSGTKLAEILDVPVGGDGSFEFGHVPSGTYLLSLFPTFPGMASLAFRVGDNDVASLQFTRPQLHRVSGKIVVQKGPLPYALLAFSTDRDYVAAPIAPDLSFHVDLPAGRQRTEMAGMPVGYSLASVRIGSQDVTEGLTIGNSDIADVVITVAPPQNLARVSGKISGLASGTPATVEMTGPILSTLQTTVRNDGSFEFPAVTPGSYSLTIPQAPQLAPIPVVVQWTDVEVPVAVTPR